MKYFMLNLVMQLLSSLFEPSTKNVKPLLTICLYKEYKTKFILRIIDEITIRFESL